jgi:hypothetical protein
MARETLEELEARAAKAEKRAKAMRARAEQLQATYDAREERNAKTRRFRLGAVVEGFLFDEPELLATLKELVQHEPLEHVRVAFRLAGGGPSWFEKPDGDEAQVVIDTRRVRLGMIVERMLPVDAALCARLERIMQQQSPYVREVFGLEGNGPSWFCPRREL